MLFSMTEIVFEMIPFGFQGVVVLIFYFPTGTASLTNLIHIFLGDQVVGDKCIAIGFFLPFLGNNNLTPVNYQRIVTIPQGNSINIAVLALLRAFGCPNFHLLMLYLVNLFKVFDKLI